MTELEELEKLHADEGNKVVPSAWCLLGIADRLLEICKEQNRMLCRFSQDSEAMQMGREEVVRTLEARLRDSPPGVLREILGPAVDPGTVRPDYESLLDRLWEARKLATVIDATMPDDTWYDCPKALKELLELLSK